MAREVRPSQGPCAAHQEVLLCLSTSRSAAVITSIPSPFRGRGRRSPPHASVAKPIRSGNRRPFSPDATRRTTAAGSRLPCWSRRGRGTQRTLGPTASHRITAVRRLTIAVAGGCAIAALVLGGPRGTEADAAKPPARRSPGAHTHALTRAPTRARARSPHARRHPRASSRSPARRPASAGPHEERAGPSPRAKAPTGQPSTAAQEQAEEAAEAQLEAEEQAQLQAEEEAEESAA